MSKKILIIGATGSIGSKLRKTLLEKTDYELTLFSTRAGSLKIDKNREKAIAGNVFDKAQLKEAVENQDVVFAALSGNLEKMAENIVEVMKNTGVKRIIFISSMGIYNELTNSKGAIGDLPNNSILMPYRKAADVIENSGLEYTVIRPGWFDEGSDDYEITKKDEQFRGHDISRQAIANFVAKLIETPDYGVNESFGISRPE
jgi:oxidoreductase